MKKLNLRNNTFCSFHIAYCSGRRVRCSIFFTRRCQGPAYAKSIKEIEEHDQTECFISCKLEVFPGSQDFEGAFYSGSQTSYIFDDTLCQNKVHVTGLDDTVDPLVEEGDLGVQVR